MRAQLLLVLLIAGIFVILSNSPVVHSQYFPCNIVNLAPTGPPTVGAGQTLQVTTAVTGSCDQSIPYVVRVDLVDGRSSQVLSSVVFPYEPVTAIFTISITNRATAPAILGAWVLQVNGYLIASMNGAVVAAAHVLFSVDVVPYSPPTTTTEQVPSNSTTTLSMTTANSTSLMAPVNETPFTTSSSSAASENANPTGSIAAVAAIVAVLAAIFIVMLSRGKRVTTQRSPEQLANVKYCGHCGTKLEAADDFCGHCGTKQT